MSLMMQISRKHRFLVALLRHAQLLQIIVMTRSSLRRSDGGKELHSDGLKQIQESAPAVSLHNDQRSKESQL